MLADKVSGTLVGLWLLAPEHLRLGTWDLLQGWTGRPGSNVDPRLALQLVHEAALCTTGIRRYRSLSQKGFELTNGLPFIATDQAIHQMLERHTVAEAEALQITLGKLRRARGHYQGHLLAIDPHRMRSWSKRQMCRQVSLQAPRPVKTSQVFFTLDAETHQPIAFTLGSSARLRGRSHFGEAKARTVAQATPGLLHLAADQTILVTFYNAPNADLLRQHYQHLPHILRAEGLDPHIPWLYNFQLDFRFK